MRIRRAFFFCVTFLSATSLALAQQAPQFARDYVYGAAGRLAVTVEPDNYPPNAPSSCSASRQACPFGGIRVTRGSASDIGSGVAFYRLYRDGSWLADFTATYYSDYDVVPNQTYTYYVTAVDNAGHEGPPSPTAQATAPPCQGGLLSPLPSPRGQPLIFAHVRLFDVPVRQPQSSERALRRLRPALLPLPAALVSAGGGGQ